MPVLTPPISPSIPVATWYNGESPCGTCGEVGTQERPVSFHVMERFHRFIGMTVSLQVLVIQPSPLIMRASSPQVMPYT